ncbi:hypothetical protein MAR_020492 [Mya arenaria]|uniref:Uncharacterized protein n=1 Tax=Mya arenaria TaxID=6604 RepID=A0ABY7E8N8_MYAAR|nr:hypothetical protein MAR_020492 [Mya arenaria]
MCSLLQGCVSSREVQGLSAGIACVYMEDCLSTVCCVQVPVINKNFEVSLEINVCENYMWLSVENFNTSILLYSTQFGSWKVFQFQGMTRLRYRLFDLYTDDKMVIDLKVQVCLSDGTNCDLDITVLDSFEFTKPLCGENNGFQLPGFLTMSKIHKSSVTFCLYVEQLDITIRDILSAIDYKDNNILSSRQEDIFLHMTNLAHFMTKTPCYVEEYNKFNGGWTNACSTASQFPILPEGNSCFLDESCKNVKCCVKIPFLSRNVQLSASIDTCTSDISIAIDDYHRTLSLSTDNIGIKHKFNLFEVFEIVYLLNQRLRFTQYQWPSHKKAADPNNIKITNQFILLRTNVKYLPSNGVFMVDMELKVCLQSNKCYIHTKLLDATRIPVPFCNYNFSLDSWASLHAISSISNMSKLEIDGLFEDLDIAQFYSGCSSRIAPATGQCEADLPLSSTNVNCYFEESCTNITCCVDLPLFKTSIQMNLEIRPCQFKALFTVGKLRRQIALVNRNEFEAVVVSLGGFMRSSLYIRDMSHEQTYVVDLSLDVCTDATHIYYSLVKDFNINAWMTERGLEFQTFTNVDTEMLMDRLQMSHILSAKTCPIQTLNGCSLHTSEAVQCSSSETCLNAECCVHSSEINQSFMFSYDIDICNFRATIQLENMQHTFDLLSYDFGTSQNISLFGMFSLRHKVLIPVDFSLSGWLEKMKYSMSTTQPDYLSKYLLDKLGISFFLKDEYNCPQHLASVWDTGSCKQLTHTLSILPDSVSCKLTTCSSAYCCYNSSVAKIPIQFYFIIDPCTLRLNIGLEKLTYNVSLLDYKYGNVEEIWIGGVFRLRFQMYKVVSPRKYVINMKFDVCWETDKCESIVLLNNNELSVEPCSYTSGFITPDFSLSSWKHENGIKPESIITENFKNQLIKTLGLTYFLLDSPCSEKKEDSQHCPLPLPFVDEQLEKTQCTLLSHCTGVRCCVTSLQTGLLFDVMLDVDPCEQTLTMQIERYQKRLSLNELEFGKNLQFWLNGVVRMSFNLLELRGDRSYVISLKISLCFEANSSCESDINILNETKIPKLKCQWGPGVQTVQDFSLTKWLNEMKLVQLSDVEDFVYEIVLTDIGIKEFLLESQCVTNQYPFIGGMNNECVAPKDVESLNGSVQCHIRKSCQMIECCATVDILKRNFYTYMSVDACNKTLTVGIEKYSYTISLVNYQFGTMEHFWLQKFTRMDFRIYNIETTSTLVVYLDLRYCLESDECVLKQTVVSQAQLPYMPCRTDEGFSIQGFSLNSWLSQNNLSDYNDIAPIQMLTLYEQLQLSNFLINDEDCKINHIQRINSGCLQATANTSDLMTCNQRSCLDLECCVNFSQLNHVFRFTVEIDNCAGNIHIALDRFAVDISLLDYSWQEEHHVNLKGVIRIS